MYFVERLEHFSASVDAVEDFDVQDAQGFVDEELTDDLGDHVSEVSEGEVEVVVDPFSHLLDEELLLFLPRGLVARWLRDAELTGRIPPNLMT